MESSKQNLIAHQGPRSGQPGEAELVHMLYDAVIDNSLWPEMISELMEHIEYSSGGTPHQVPERFQSIVTHFERAMRLSENIVALQERNSTLGGVLDSLAVGLMVFDHTGSRIFSNKAASDHGFDYATLSALQRKHERLAHMSDGMPPQLSEDSGGGADVALISAKALKGGVLPPNAAKIAVILPAMSRQSFDDFRRTYYLSDAEARLVEALHGSSSLRKAAAQCGITYESARTYLKRVYLKTGVNDQSSLLLLVDRNPLSLLGRETVRDENALSVRRNLLLEDGRNLEYFSLGPKDGHLLLHVDALTGVALEVIGTPERYLPKLEALGVHLVVPCRPGTFGSHFKKLGGLSDFTPDLLQLMDHLGAKQATLLSQAFGSCSALAFAATAPDRVDKVLMCAPSYPRHEPDDWRSMDVFYIISGVIGRRAPALLKAIVPYLMRSVMQNTSKYLARHIARSKCPADIEVLSSPQLQRRIPEMLALRTQLGTDGLVQENFLNTHGWDFDLSEISAPVHIIQGSLDNVSDPEGSAKLQTAVPECTLHEFSRLGQYLMFSEWPWIIDACAPEANSGQIIAQGNAQHSRAHGITAA